MRRLFAIILCLIQIFVLLACGKTDTTAAEGTIVKDEVGSVQSSENASPLTLITFGQSDSLQLLVAKFNKLHPDSSIDLIDYTDNYSVDFDSARKRLTAEIVSGKLPDMVCFSNVSPYPYIRKGLLIDLFNFLNSDPELTVDDLAISNALAAENSVYFIDNTFYLETLLGKYTRFGDRFGWTFSEYINVDNSAESGTHTIYNITGPSFLRRIAQRYSQTAIDWDEGKCDYNNSDFIKILGASTSIRETPVDPNNPIFALGSEAVANGEMITTLSWVNTVWKLANEEKIAGCKLSTIGWPTVDGSCGTDIYYSNPLGIFNNTGHEKDCWEFIKFMIKNAQIDSPEGIPVAFEDGIPIYMPLLEEKIQRVKNSDEYPVKLTDENVDRFFILLSHTTNIALYDESIEKIIDAESGALFSKEKTPDEVAELIQSKVSIYLSEQS